MWKSPKEANMIEGLKLQNVENGRNTKSARQGICEADELEGTIEVHKNNYVWYEYNAFTFLKASNNAELRSILCI